MVAIDRKARDDQRDQREDPGDMGRRDAVKREPETVMLVAAVVARKACVHRPGVFALSNP